MDTFVGRFVLVFDFKSIKDEGLRWITSLKIRFLSLLY